MRIHIRRLLKKVKFYLEDIFFSNEFNIRVDWVHGSNNFGDVLNPILIYHLSGLKVIQVSSKIYKKDHFFIIGSILNRATRYTSVWGAGFISREDSFIENPKNIYAVRGPETRKKLLEEGIKCPQIYGDPALLLPKIYNPSIEKKYKLGIVPHYLDKDNIWLKSLVVNQDILILNIQEKNPFDFVDSLLSCEKIASSSLHGIIVADAYSIPSIWVEFSKKVVGDGFKFKDYFQSVGRCEEEPFRIQEDLSVDQILNQFYDYKLKIDLEKLLNTAPFKINVIPVDKNCYN